VSRFLFIASSIYVIVWCVSAVVAEYLKLGIAKHIQAELRPLYLPAIVASHAIATWHGGDPANVGRLIGTACGIANYWLFKDDDDDRWKRRRRKLAEKVGRAANGRLVAVPVSAR
jgi:hypothetical protein